MTSLLPIFTVHWSTIMENLLRHSVHVVTEQNNILMSDISYSFQSLHHWSCYMYKNRFSLFIVTPTCIIIYRRLHYIKQQSCHSPFHSYSKKRRLSSSALTPPVALTTKRKSIHRVWAPGGQKAKSSRPSGLEVKTRQGNKQWLSAQLVKEKKQIMNRPPKARHLAKTQQVNTWIRVFNCTLMGKFCGDFFTICKCLRKYKINSCFWRLRVFSNRKI